MLIACCISCVINIYLKGGFNGLTERIKAQQNESHQNESVSCDSDYHGGSVFSGEEYNEYP
jgi:hypothetical protein